jgi:hypothetical protein
MISKKVKAALATVVALVVAAIMVDFRTGHWRVWAAELGWKISALLTFVLNWMGHDAHESIQYMSANAAGLGVILTAIGVAANIYYMHKGSLKAPDTNEEGKQ